MTESFPDYFTIGYSGRSIDDFVDALVNAGVETLLDVRYNAVSMYKPAFSKRNLEAALQQRNIDYVHLPYLGVPSDIRNVALAESNRQKIWEWYDEHVVPRASRNIDWLINGANHPVALMCVEADSHECHRHRLALALERQGLHGCDL